MPVPRRHTDDAAMTRMAVAARRGDRRAATAFVRATQDQLRSLMRYLAGADVADDLVQETYLRAFTALPRYAEQAPARAWLLSIARRVAADHIRSARRRPRTVPLPEGVDLPEVARESEPAELVALRRTVLALEPERREAFVLTRVLGLSYAEAAEVCGCPVGTIRSRVFRARADLVAAFGDRDDAPSALGG